MTKPKKKPKTGDVVGWGVCEIEHSIVVDGFKSRQEARKVKSSWNSQFPKLNPYRIVKFVVEK